MTLVACVVRCKKKIIINSANVTEMDVAEKSQQSKSSFIMHLVQKSFGIWHAKGALVLLLLPFFELVSHTICHTFFLFPILPSFSRSSHLQIMKAIMLLLRQTPFYDYEFLVVVRGPSTVCIFACKLYDHIKYGPMLSTN